MKKIFLILISVFLVFYTIGCSKENKIPVSDKEIENQQEANQETITNKNEEPVQPKEDKQMSSAPEMQIETNKQYFALLDTNMGKIKIKFFPKEAPKTVNNFVTIAKKGLYDETIFHRVIKDFMIQCGDLGSAISYTFEDEINSKKLVRGIVAMANGGPNTNTSQFFIVTTQSTPWLDGKHTAFGEVVEGMDTVDKIESVQTVPGDRPASEVKINKVTIEEK